MLGMTQRILLSTTILMNKNSSNFFYEMRALSNLSTISTWDTTKVTNMSSMFSYAGYSATTFNLDLSSWNTASVTSMSEMFSYAGRNATNWSIVGLSSWDTSSVTSMGSMFIYASYSATTWSITIPKTNDGTVSLVQFLTLLQTFTAKILRLLQLQILVGLSLSQTKTIRNLSTKAPSIHTKVTVHPRQPPPLLTLVFFRHLCYNTP